MQLRRRELGLRLGIERKKSDRLFKTLRRPGLSVSASDAVAECYGYILHSLQMNAAIVTVHDRWVRNCVYVYREFASSVKYVFAVERTVRFLHLRR